MNVYITFFVINNMAICKPIVKLYITNKKNVQPLENIYNFIKIWFFNYEKWAFFPKGNFVFWWGLRPKPNLPRSWTGLATTSTYN